MNTFRMTVACGLIAMLPSIFSAVAQETNAPNQNETKEQRDARMKWWREAKFGMFIHWGVYSVPAGKYKDTDNHGEWIMCTAKIPMAEYKDYTKRFNPVKFNAEAWVKIAKAAGQKYIVITSKHHDGFAMFQSKTSDYNIYDATPFKRDPLKELAAACEKEGIKLGFYYSQAQDWGHVGGAASRGHWDPAQDGDFDAYLDKVAVPQVKEILTNYGQFPAVLWFDTPATMTPERAAKFFPLLKTRPDLIINNRLGGGFKGDTETPEQFIPANGFPGRDWETCMTLNGHWGYCQSDTNWKSADDLIRKLAEVASKGGNYLLNVGPTSEGEIPAPCVEILKKVGDWMKVNSESIYGTTGGPFSYLSWGRASRKDHKLFLHVHQWPANGVLRVPLANKVSNAALLVSPGKKLETKTEGNLVLISVPATAPDAVDSVITLDFEGDPVVPTPPALNKSAKASSCQKGAKPEHALDGNASTAWQGEKGTTNGWLEVDLGKPTQINFMSFEEPGRDKDKRGQKYELQYRDGEKWTTVVKGSSGGHGDAKTFPVVTAQVFRLEIKSAKDRPGVSEMQLFGPE